MAIKKQLKMYHFKLRNIKTGEWEYSGMFYRKNKAEALKFIKQFVKKEKINLNKYRLLLK